MIQLCVYVCVVRLCKLQLLCERKTENKFPKYEPNQISFPESLLENREIKIFVFYPESKFETNYLAKLIKKKI